MNKRLFDILLKDQVFETYGYKYRFDDIRNVSGKVVLDICWLPDFYPHSYVWEKMYSDCSDIISDRMRYAGETFKFSKDQFNIYTEKGELKRGYVRKYLLNEIVKRLNEIASIKRTFYHKEYILHCRWTLNETPFLIALDGDVMFRFDLMIDDILVDGKSVDVNPNKNKNAILGQFQDKLYDSDLHIFVNNVSYEMANPEFRLEDSDIYINSEFNIVEFKGKVVRPYFGDLDKSFQLFV